MQRWCRLTEEERIRLRHMLEAAQAAISDCEGRGRGDLDSNPTLARSVVRCLEVVGEPAQSGRLGSHSSRRSTANRRLSVKPKRA